MKKSAYKLQIQELNRVIANLIDRVAELSEYNADLNEALERRRKLYTSMLELVNRGQPKSMDDMAKSLFEIFKHPATSWDSERPEEKDKWMDAVLKIIG